MNMDIEETIQLLLQAGAELNRIDHEGWISLNVMSWSLFHITDMLQQSCTLDWQVRTVTGENVLNVCDNRDDQSKHGKHCRVFCHEHWLLVSCMASSYAVFYTFQGGWFQ